MQQASYCYLTDQDWAERLARFAAIARSCTLCPRNCHINRLRGEQGFCNAGNTLRISSIFPHHGEEPPISGTHGSGTIFFSHCTLQCCFCQNYQISHENIGQTYTTDALASSMLDLQNQGCHNINLVTATHFLPWILPALQRAMQRGLKIPIVYNSSGYEHASTIALLQGIVDIYLPDMKYGDDDAARRLSGTARYTLFNHATIREMFRQTGPIKTTSSGIALRGTIIRHLVLPARSAGSNAVLEFLLQTFDPDDITVSLMAQYRPLYKAFMHPEINRPITAAEYNSIKNLFIYAGFGGFYQEHDTLNDAFVIDFTQRKSEALLEDKDTNV